MTGGGGGNGILDGQVSFHGLTRGDLPGFFAVAQGWIYLDWLGLALTADGLWQRVARGE